MIPQSLGTMAAYVSIDSSQVKTGLRRVQSQLQGFSQSLRRSGLTTIAIGVGITAPLVKALRVFGAFDDQMRLTKAVTGATGEAFEVLTNQAKLLGRTTSYTASQVAASMVELGRAGFAVQEIEAAISPLLNMARATGTDLPAAANMAASTLRAFSMDAKKMSDVADIMTAAANNSAQTLTDLGESMRYAAPVAADFGMNLKETAKAISTMANFSIRGSMAGTSLRMVMLRLADENVRGRLEDIGVAVSDMEGNLRGVTEILQDVHKQIQSLPGAERLAFMGTLFGARAVSGGLKLASANFAELNRAIDNAAGSARRTAEEMDAGLGGALRMLWSAVEGTTIAIGEGLAPAVSDLAEKLISALGPTTEFIERNKWLLEVVGGLGLAFLALGTSMLVVAGVTWTIGKAVVVATIAFKALSAVLLFLAANPVVLAIAALAAAFGLAIYASNQLVGRVAQLTNVTKGLLEAGDKQRQMDELRIQRLRQLANKERLNTAEQKEAKTLVEELTDRYGDLGISIDDTTGKIEGLAGAYEAMATAMKTAALTQIDIQIEERRANIRELQAEIDSVWLRTGRIEGLTKKQMAEYDRIIALRKRRTAVEEGGAGALTGGVGPGGDLKSRIDAENRLQAEAFQLVQRWELKLASVKLQGIQSETKRQLDEIDLRYEYALKSAGDNARAIALIEKVHEIETGLVHAKLVGEWERRVAELRIQGIKDETQQRLAEIDLRYKYELKRAKGNAKAIAKIEEARELERRGVLEGIQEKVIRPASILALAEKGTREAYSAVVKQEQDSVKKTAENTKVMVQQQKKTNEILVTKGEALSDVGVFDLGLAGVG